MINGEDVLRERVAGRSTRAIARQFGRTVDEINAVLDAVSEPITPEYKVRAISVDLERLDAMQAVFHTRAIEGDVAAAALCIKISERRASLLGLDQPARFDVIELRAAASPAPSGTDRVYAALARLSHGSNGAGTDSDAPPRPD